MQALYKCHMGDDLLVVDAARVSFSKESWYIDGDYIPNKDSKRYNKWLAYAQKMQAQGRDILSVADYGLINFLAEHGHWTPAAHPQITLVMKAPVPIRTQCFKHKQGFVENEESRRYIKSTPELYVPDEFRMAPKSAKQGSGGVHADSEFFKRTYESACYHMIDLYESYIEDGVAPEQARFLLPQGVQVNWYWTGSLAAFARYYGLRSASDSQQESADLANEVGSLIRELYPVSWEAFTK